MIYKQLVQDKIEILKNKVRALDTLYRRAANSYEMDQVYRQISETIEEMETLINSEYEEG